MINLTNPNDRKSLAQRIHSDIEDYCTYTYNSGHRDHLGASTIGDVCSRRLWYSFRWVKSETFSGRMQRLFQVGHKAEDRFVGYLKAIGFEIINKQARISGCNGHYGGSLDGTCRAPSRYELPEELIFLNEFKTNGTGSGYTKVAEDGIAKAKPKHFAQMSAYGYKTKIKYGIYLIENKNDSDITIEIVELDWQLGQELERKANDIINSSTPPLRINDNPSYFECKYCNFANICHNEAQVEKNCRSCKFAKPIENAKWYCGKWNNIIPKEFIKQGCEAHASIN